MTQALNTTKGTRKQSAPTGRVGKRLRGRDHRRERAVVGILAELQQMTPAERIRASRYTMKRWEYWVYAARFSDEIPTVNGELERIALTLE
jgi:hypothetical protein